VAESRKSPKLPWFVGTVYAACIGANIAADLQLPSLRCARADQVQPGGAQQTSGSLEVIEKLPSRVLAGRDCSLEQEKPETAFCVFYVSPELLEDTT